MSPSTAPSSRLTLASVRVGVGVRVRVKVRVIRVSARVRVRVGGRVRARVRAAALGSASAPLPRPRPQPYGPGRPNSSLATALAALRSHESREPASGKPAYPEPAAEHVLSLQRLSQKAEDLRPKLTLSLSLSLSLTNLSLSLGGRPRDRLGRQLHAVHSAQVVLLACMQRSAHTTGYSAPKAAALCPLASAGLHAV